MSNAKQPDTAPKPSQIERLRHDLGNGFVAALDDIRQRVVEEGWSGQTQTTSHQLQSHFDDPLSGWLDKVPDGSKPPAPSTRAEWDAEWNDRSARESTAVAHAFAVELCGGEVDPQSRAWVGEMMAEHDALALQWEALWGRSSLGGELAERCQATLDTRGPEPEGGQHGIDP